jgi:hypothetical protein
MFPQFINDLDPARMNIKKTPCCIYLDSQSDTWNKLILFF